MAHICGRRSNFRFGSNSGVTVSQPCPHFPEEETSPGVLGRSVSCQRETSASLDHLIGAACANKVTDPYRLLWRTKTFGLFLLPTPFVEV